VDPSEDHTLPEAFNLGMTNLVQRPTREASELTPSEMRGSVPLLLSKITHYKPRIVCFVGVGIAETVSSYLALKKGNAKGKGKRKGGPGMLPFKLAYEREGEKSCRVSETLLYAVSSTSGRVVAYSKGDKVKQFQSVNRLLRQIQTGGYKAADDVTAVYTRDLGAL
jgi:TDG/mug DNA glycosylase family protein